MRRLSALTTAARSWYAAHELIGTNALNGLVALVSWGLASLVLMPGSGGRSVTPIWPPVGLAVALTYIGGYRLLPGIVLGSLALGLRYNAWPLALLLALVQVVQPVVDVRILKALDFDPRLERVRDPLILMLVAGPAGSFIAALLAWFLYFLYGVRTIEAMPYDFMLWWLRDWLGVMVTAPLILSWSYGGRSSGNEWKRFGEAVTLLLMLFVALQLMFGLWRMFATRDVPIAFVVFPLIGWAGVRFGPRGAATLVAIISTLVIAIAGRGIGPFSAAAILLRGLGRMDELPLSRFADEARALYGATYDEPTVARRYADLIGYWSFYLKTGIARRAGARRPPRRAAR